MLSLADRLAILSFEAALDRNRWLWSQISLLAGALESALLHSGLRLGLAPLP